MKKKTDDNFIMLPIVDFCFKELMLNAKVRQGFIAALLAVNPEVVQETELMPTILHQEYADDKLGILDVRVKLIDGTQIDFEMQVASFTMKAQEAELWANADWLLSCMHAALSEMELWANIELSRVVRLLGKTNSFLSQ